MELPYFWLIVLLIVIRASRRITYILSPTVIESKVLLRISYLCTKRFSHVLIFLSLLIKTWFCILSSFIKLWTFLTFPPWVWGYIRGRELYRIPCTGTNCFFLILLLFLSLKYSYIFFVSNLHLQICSTCCYKLALLRRNALAVWQL